jgi:hypothetical protein
LATEQDGAQLVKEGMTDPAKAFKITPHGKLSLRTSVLYILQAMKQSPAL